MHYTYGFLQHAHLFLHKNPLDLGPKGEKNMLMLKYLPDPVDLKFIIKKIPVKGAPPQGGGGGADEVGPKAQG